MAIQEVQKQFQKKSSKQLEELKNNKSSKSKFAFLLLIIPVGLLVFYTLTSTQTEKASNKQFIDETNGVYAIYSIDIPEKLEFANERVPLENYDVYETIDREFLVNTYWQSQTILFLKRANKYFPIIEPILKQNNIPDDFKYIAVIESGLTNAVSPSGAKGFWQFLKATGKEYKLEVNSEVDERYNLEKSTQAACDYFNDAYKKFNNWTLVAASYNMGRSGLNKQLKRQITNNYWDLLLNNETSRYVNRIIAVKMIMSNPETFGFHVRKKDMYPFVPTTTIEVDTIVNNLTIFAYKNGVNYKILKNLNPWLRQNYLKNKYKKKYTLKIPVEGYRNFNIPDSLKN